VVPRGGGNRLIYPWLRIKVGRMGRLR